MEKPLVHNDYVLKKFAGKGGWTYAEVPEIEAGKHSPFGWIKVKGRIDSYEFTNVHLMPMGNSRLFFPVKAEIRKKIKKDVGDKVTIVLYRDDSKLQIPQELEDCLKSEPEAYQNFLKLKQGVQKEFITWIYSAKREETKVERIVKTIEKMQKGEGFRARLMDL